MSYWSIVKEKDINGDFEIFDNLRIPLKRREYSNNNELASIKKLTILGYASNLKIILELNNQILLGSLKALYVQICQYFPVELKTLQQHYISLTVEENEAGREQLSNFLDYLHYEVESIEPKVVRDDMKKSLGIKRIRDDEDIYREIAKTAKNKEISAAKVLAEQAFQKGYSRAYYCLGTALYYDSEFKEAFEALKKVPDDSVYEQDYCQANELLAKLVLKENVVSLEKTEKCTLAFKYANKAKGLESAVMLREDLFIKLEQQLIIAKQKIQELETQQCDLKTSLTPNFNRFRTTRIDLETPPRIVSPNRVTHTHFLPPIHKISPQDAVETSDQELTRKKTLSKTHSSMQ